MPAHKGLMIALVSAALVGCGTVGGWFGQGAQPLKVKPAELVEFVPALQLVKAWDAQVGDGRGRALVPGGSDDAIFVAGNDGQVSRIELQSGRIAWRVDTGRSISAGVGVGPRLVTVGTLKGEVVALNAADGSQAWSVKVGGEILTPPVVEGDDVVVRTTDGRIHLLSATDGRRKWVQSRALPALILRQPGSPALSAAMIYAGHPGGKITGLSRANGAIVWEANIALPKGSSEIERIADVTGALALDDRLVCGVAYQGRLTCLDASKGSPIWSRDFSGLSGVAQDGRFLYAVNIDDEVVAHDKLRGSAVWKQDRLKGRQLSPPLVVGRYLVLGDLQGYIHVLDSDSGAFLARHATDGSPITGDMLALDNGFVVQTGKGSVYAFRFRAGSER